MCMQHILNVTKPRTVLHRKGTHASFPSFGVIKLKNRISYTSFLAISAKLQKRHENLYISAFFSGIYALKHTGLDTFCR